MPFPAYHVHGVQNSIYQSPQATRHNIDAIFYYKTFRLLLTLTVKVSPLASCISFSVINVQCHLDSYHPMKFNDMLALIAFLR